MKKRVLFASLDVSSETVNIISRPSRRMLRFSSFSLSRDFSREFDERRCRDRISRVRRDELFSIGRSFVYFSYLIVARRTKRESTKRLSIVDGTLARISESKADRDTLLAPDLRKVG